MSSEQQSMTPVSIEQYFDCLPIPVTFKWSDLNNDGAYFRLEIPNEIVTFTLMK